MIPPIIVDEIIIICVVDKVDLSVGILHVLVIESA